MRRPFKLIKVGRHNGKGEAKQKSNYENRQQPAESHEIDANRGARQEEPCKEINKQEGGKEGERERERERGD